VSCGRENRFGHPAPAVLARYAAHRALVFRTDRDGEIDLTTDGRQVDVVTFTGRHYVTQAGPEGRRDAVRTERRLNGR
jgi:competence protein ComEC